MTTADTTATRETPADRWYGVYPAVVHDVADPEHLGRVSVHLPFSADQGGPGPTSKAQALVLWARVAVPSAGSGYGLWCRPHSGDEVLVAFEGGDPARPYVVGCLWSRPSPPPPDRDDSSDNRTTVLRTRQGSVILLDDSQGEERVEIRTPGGVRLTLADGPSANLELQTAEGRKIELDDGVNRIKITDPAGSTIELGPGGVTVAANQVAIDASNVTVNAANASFSGVVQCDTLIANSVVAKSYTPGAGNIW